MFWKLEKTVHKTWNICSADIYYIHKLPEIMEVYFKISSQKYRYLFDFEKYYYWCNTNDGDWD